MPVIIFFILDASVAIDWLLYGGPKPSYITQLASSKQSRLIVPHLWHAEVRYVLLGYLRRKAISRAQFADCIGRLNSLVVQTDMQVASEWTLELAEKHSLSLYDAMYLELAIELAKSNSVSLATLDKVLVRAAKAEGIPARLPKRLMSGRRILERSAVFEEKRFEGGLGYDYENDGRGLMLSPSFSFERVENDNGRVSFKRTLVGDLGYGAAVNLFVDSGLSKVNVSAAASSRATAVASYGWSFAGRGSRLLV